MPRMEGPARQRTRPYRISYDALPLTICLVALVPMTISAGTRLGTYEILVPLGAGGMGEIYRARDRKLDRDVAIKVLPQSIAADPDMLARFEREAKAVAALSHPNILSIFDFGVQGGISYAVMELLEGETLRGKLDAGPISQKLAVDYALQVARVSPPRTGRASSIAT